MQTPPVKTAFRFTFDTPQTPPSVSPPQAPGADRARPNPESVDMESINMRLFFEDQEDDDTEMSDVGEF